MLNYLRKISSLNNLVRGKASGQIATILILLIVAVLAVILITANLGQVSVQTTNLSNAADSAALSLGSQLSSKASNPSAQLDAEKGGSKTKVCSKGGILSLVLAVVCAALCVLIPPLGLGMAPIAAGMMGGAIGGTIGGGIVGGTKGAIMGTVTGAMTGAAVGYGIGALQQASTGALGAGSTVGGSTTTTSAQVVGRGALVQMPGELTPVVVDAGTVVPAGTNIIAGCAEGLSGLGAAATPTGTVFMSSSMLESGVATAGTSGATVTKTLADGSMQTTVLKAGEQVGLQTGMEITQGSVSMQVGSQTLTFAPGATSTMPTGALSNAGTAQGQTTIERTVSESTNAKLTADGPVKAATDMVVEKGGVAETISSGTTFQGEAGVKVLQGTGTQTINASSGAQVAMQVGDTVTSGAVALNMTPIQAVAPAIGVAGKVYSEGVQSHNMSTAMATFAKMLNSMPEYERIRESAFLTAMVQAVDDPTQVQDAKDVDDDGDTTEAISAFAVWWKDRFDNVVVPCVSATFGETEKYIEKLKAYREELKLFLGDLARQEVECDIEHCGVTEGSEGPMLKLWRDVQGCGYKSIDFFEAGPGQEELLAWYECGDCEGSPPEGYDQVDASRYQMEEFLQGTRPLLHKDPKELDLSYNDWIGLLVADGEAEGWDQDDECGSSGSGDEEDKGLVDSLGEVRDNILNWKEKTLEAREEVPRCMLAHSAHDSETMLAVAPPLSCSSVAEDHDPNNDFPSVLPCPWKREAMVEDGAYIWNYPCRIKSPKWGDATDEAGMLLEQIGLVRAAADGIEEDIKEKHPAPEGAKKVEYHIDISNVSYTNDIQDDGTVTGKCNKESDAGEGKLTYYGTYWIEYDITVTSESCCCKCKDGDTSDCNKDSCDGVSCKDKSTPEKTTCSERHDEHRRDPPTGSYTLEGDNFVIVEGAGSLAVSERSLGEFEQALSDLEELVDTYEDPFIAAALKLDEEWLAMNGFIIDTGAYVNTMKNSTRNYATNGADYSKGCYGPPKYEWADSRGSHWVMAETGAWKVAKIKRHYSGNTIYNKTCLKLKCYQDNGKAWIKVSRNDQPNVPVSDAGKHPGNIMNVMRWNPGRGNISRCSKVSYSYDHLNISDNSGCK